MNRMLRSRVAGVIVASLGATGVTLAPATSAMAVASCFDYVDFTTKISTIVGTDAKNTIVAPTNSVVSALAGNDKVIAEDGAPRIVACLDAGDDGFAQRTSNLSFNTSYSVSGGDGGDAISGGDGNDSLRGDAGIDSIDGKGGNDTINGGDGNDTLFGQAGNDVIRGDAGDDTIFGEAGDDILYGGSGTGVIDGGPGIDICSGGGAYVNCEVL